MPYVIIDPVSDYASYIIEFLNRWDQKAIGVFLEEGHYWAFNHMFKNNLGHCFVDEYLVTEYPDLRALANQILTDWPAEELSGIIPWGEMNTEMGAELGEYLGIDWNPREVLHRFRNKFAMKQYLRDHGSMRINASLLVHDEHEALEFQRNLGHWPVVVKPTEGAGSRNVYFTWNEGELIQRCYDVFNGKTGDVLLEEYIGGNEFVVNGIVDADHRMLVTDVWYYDKRESHGIPNLYYETHKVNSYDPVFWPLAHYAAEVVECLGVRKAPIHMELKIDDYGPCLVEVGARFAGGNQPLLASRVHDRSLFELAACHYIADIPLRPDDIDYGKYDALQARLVSGIQTYDIQSISAIYGMSEISRLPSFFMFDNIKPVGSYLPLTRDLYTRSYEVYLIHPDSQQIAQDAEAVRELLRYE